jgi:hypothetical protein
MWDCYDLHFTPFHVRDEKWAVDRADMLRRCQNADAFVRRLEDRAVLPA